MSFQSNSQPNSEMPWFHREKRDRLPDRIKQIQRINDPTTYTDEVLTACRWLITLLLCFSGVLGALSYFQNFSISFPFEVAVFLAVSLTVVIEWGKNRAATWATRIPFFQGWNHIWRTPANTFVFVGLVLVAVATFTMSIYNSTKGGEQLARMLSHEKNTVAFVPDTRGVDAQIEAAQNNIASAPKAKWKGKEYYQDARSVRASSKTLESLTRQKEDLVKLQRADYERNLSIQQSQTNFAARLVLASGGWIELLQVLLIILRVACERNLDGRSSYANQFKNGYQGERRVGFNINPSTGNVNNAYQSTVTHEPPAVTQQMPNAGVSMSPEEALRWFETELRREPSNLQNRRANPDTVMARIQTKLDRTEKFISECPDNSIDPGASGRFLDYLNDNLFQVVTPRPSLLSLIQQKTAQHENA